MLRNVLRTGWKLKFGHKVKFLFRLWAQGLVMILKLKRDFEDKVWSVFYCWCLVEAMKLNLGRNSEARVGQDFEVEVCRNDDVWLRFWSWCLVDILKMKFDQDLCLDLWYDLNKLLNPQVCCAFGSVFALKPNWIKINNVSLSFILWKLSSTPWEIWQWKFKIHQSKCALCNLLLRITQYLK